MTSMVGGEGAAANKEKSNCNRNKILVVFSSFEFQEGFIQDEIDDEENRATDALMIK